jgi:dCMP deaminase
VELIISAKPMSKWDFRFCQLAKFVSEWSKDPNAKVGAVVVAKRGGDISVGYNGFPMGVDDSAERLQNQHVKLEMVVHAEQNALIAAGSRASGSTLYVVGKPICSGCAGSIIQAGIKRVVALSPEAVNRTSKWYKKGKNAILMFNEAGVVVDLYEDRAIDNAATGLPPDVHKRVVAKGPGANGHRAARAAQRA